MLKCFECGKPGFYVCPYCMEWWTFDNECYCDYQDEEGYDEDFCHPHCMGILSWINDPRSLYCYEVLHEEDDWDDEEIDEGIFDM